MAYCSAPITLLPQEIIECIACCLPLAGLCSLRLTCKALAVTSSYYLGDTYCTQVWLNLSLASVQTLDYRSRSPWARHVKILHLRWDEEAGHGLVWERDTSNAILPTLPVLQTVRDSIIRFANCRSIYLSAPYDYDYMFPPRLDAIGYSDMLGISFLLITETNLLLQKFHVAFGTEGSEYRVKTSQIHLEQVKKPAFKRAFSSLEELSLRLSVEDGPCDWIENLVSDTIHLQKLEWRVQIPRPFCFQSASLSCLRELSLQHGLISEKNLIESLLQCRHCLQSLSLFQVRLDRSWTQVFRVLGSFDSLQGLSLHFLRVGPGASRPRAFSGLSDDIEVPEAFGQKLRLRRKGVPGRTRVVGVDYNGPGMGNVVAMLTNSIEG
jgi:hypothetical protein